MFFLFLTVSRAILCADSSAPTGGQTCAAIAASVTYAVVLKTVHLHGDEWESTVGLVDPADDRRAQDFDVFGKGARTEYHSASSNYDTVYRVFFVSGGSTQLLARSDFWCRSDYSRPGWRPRPG